MKRREKENTLIATFLQYLRDEKRYSPRTLSAYRTDIRQFATFVWRSYQNAELENVHYHMIREWIVSMMEGGNEARSINRKTACLRSLYKFCMKKAIINQDPTLKIKALKTPKRLPHFVKEEEMVQLLDRFQFEDDFKGWRDRLIIEMLYDTGIRQSELIGLKTAHVNRWENTIKVLGKRNKERIIPFPKMLMTVIDNYQQKKNQTVEKPHSDFLLVTSKGTPLYPMMVYRTTRKYLDMFSKAEKRSPHVLRHTFATHMLNKGAAIKAVQELLGHSSLSATQIYTHNSIEKLKKAFDQAHPKA